MIVTVIMYFTTICLMLEYWVHLSHFSTLTHDIDVDSTLIWLFQLWCTFAHRQTLIFSLSSGPSAVLAICDLVTRLHRDEGFYSLICKFSLVSPLCDGEARCEPFNVRAWLIVFFGRLSNPSHVEPKQAKPLTEGCHDPNQNPKQTGANNTLLHCTQRKCDMT